MSDRPQTAKIIADIVNQMEDMPLDWYVQNVTRLAEFLQTSYESAHRLILTMKNQ